MELIARSILSLILPSRPDYFNFFNFLYDRFTP